ncbi:MAG TPA: F0F1 ATP synthase subunit B, partial [Actinomycetota bacterium]|nr:F0F1 ATP synthase subunit B [Actinomycetota bacterium]
MSYVVNGLPRALAQEETHTGTQEEQAPAEENEASDLYPHANELIVGAIAFAVLFFFVWKWVLPRLNTVLEARREKIQGQLEEAERARREADEVRRRYEDQLKEARGEANRIIEEARKTAESLSKDMLAKAEDESRKVVARAQEEIRSERERVFEELKATVAELSISVAERVVGESLTKDRQMKLVDSYIAELAGK